MTLEALLGYVPASRTGGFPVESLWSQAAVLELRRAQDGREPVYPTQVRLLDDGERLFVRFDCDDADVWATHDRRDDPLWEEEVVEVFLAPGEGVPSRYCEIEVNPLGAIFDARVDNPEGRRETMRVDPAWDAPGLTARISRPSTGGWRAELALPWDDLSEGPIPSVWRANFFRIERPHGLAPEFTCWSPTFVNPPDFHIPSRFGRLVRARMAGRR